MLNLQLSRQLPIQRPVLAKAADNYRFKPIVECVRLACGLVGIVTTTVGFFFASINLFKTKENRAFSVRRWRLLHVHAQQESKYAIRTLVPFLFGKVDNRDIASEWAISKAIVAADLKEFSSRNIVPQTANTPSLQQQQQLFAKHVYVGSECPLVFAQKANLDTIAKLLRSSGITDHIQMASLRPDNRSEKAGLARFQQACQKNPDTNPLLIALKAAMVEAKGDKGMSASITPEKQKPIEQCNEVPLKLASLHQIATKTESEPLLESVETQFMDACIHGKSDVANVLLGRGFSLDQGHYLWHACHAGNLAIVEKLIARGASRATPPLESPLIYDLGIQYVREATPAKKEAYLTILKLLLAKHPELSTDLLSHNGTRMTPLPYFMLQDGWEADKKIAHEELYPVINLLIEAGNKLSISPLAFQYTVGSGENARTGYLIDVITEEERAVFVKQLPNDLFYTLGDEVCSRIMPYLCQPQNHSKLAAVLVPSRRDPTKDSAIKKMLRIVFNIARSNRDLGLMRTVMDGYNCMWRGEGRQCRIPLFYNTADPLSVALEQSCPEVALEMLCSMPEQERNQALASIPDPFITIGMRDAKLRLELLKGLSSNPGRMRAVLSGQGEFKKLFGDIFSDIQTSGRENILVLLPVMRALLDVLTVEGTGALSEESKNRFIEEVRQDQRSTPWQVACAARFSSIASAILDNVNDATRDKLLTSLNRSECYWLLSTIPKPEYIRNFLEQNIQRVSDFFSFHQGSAVKMDSNTVKTLWNRLFEDAVRLQKQALINMLLNCGCDATYVQPAPGDKTAFLNNLITMGLPPAVVAMRANAASVLSVLMSNFGQEKRQACFTELLTDLQGMQWILQERNSQRFGAYVTEHTTLFPIALRYGSTELIDMLIRAPLTPEYTQAIKRMLKEASASPDATLSRSAFSAIYRHEMTGLIPKMFANAYVNGQLSHLIGAFRQTVPLPSSAGAQPQPSTIQHSGQVASSSGASAPARAAQLSGDDPAPGPSAARSATEVPHLSFFGVDATDREEERLIAILEKHRTAVAASPRKDQLYPRFLKPLLSTWNIYNLLKPAERRTQIEALLVRLDAMTSPQLCGTGRNPEPHGFLGEYDLINLNRDVLQCPFLISNGRTMYVKKDFLSKNPEIALTTIAKSQQIIYRSVQFLQDDWAHTGASDAGGPSREFTTALLDGVFSGTAERLIQRKKVNVLIEDQSESVTIPEYVSAKKPIEVPALTPEQERALTREQKSARKHLIAKAKKALDDDTICIDLKHQDALYRALGDLFVQCYTTEGMKTGDFFHPSYFHLVQQLYLEGSNPNIFTNESDISDQKKLTLLRIYQNTVIEAQRARFESQIAPIQEGLPGAPARLEQKQRELVEKVAEIERTPEGARETLEEQKINIEAEIGTLRLLINGGGPLRLLREAMEPTDDDLMGQWNSYKNKIRAALLVAQGMRGRLGAGSSALNEATFLGTTAAEITEAIQGPPWNFQAFKNNFANYVTAGNNVTPEELAIGKALFTRWLNEHSEQDAKRLCATITGSKTNHRGLQIQYMSRLEKLASETHVCGKVMYLSTLLLGNDDSEEERYQLFSGVIDVATGFAMSGQSYNDI